MHMWVRLEDLDFLSNNQATRLFRVWVGPILEGNMGRLSAYMIPFYVQISVTNHCSDGKICKGFQL